MTLVNQGINIFNESDNFYTDLCYDYNYSTDKDIALQDRKKLFYPNITLCDSGCNQTNINLTKMMATSDCEFNDLSLDDDETLNKINLLLKNELVEDLLGDILDFISSSNIQVSKCGNKSNKSLLKCYGIYIILIIFIIITVFSILYFSLGLSKIQVYIYNNTHDYLKYISFNDNIKHAAPLKNKKSKTEKIKKDSKKDIVFDRKKIQIKTSFDARHNNLKNTNIANRKESSKSFLPLKKKNILKQMSISENMEISNNKDELIKISKYFREYFLENFDEMEYDDAIIKDKRKFIEYFSDNLKDKQIIGNTFVSNDPFKPRSIKIILFCLNIVFYFVVTGLFINDDYISEVYNSNEKENFSSFIQRSIDILFYSTLVNVIIEFIVDFFFVEEKKMKGIYLREKDNQNVLKSEIINLSNGIKIRYLSFIIFVYIVLFLSLYYLICFNSIYPNIQTEWIEASIFIFLIRQIISVLQCLLETIFRFLSFKFENERLFKFAKFVN